MHLNNDKIKLSIIESDISEKINQWVSEDDDSYFLEELLDENINLNKKIIQLDIVAEINGSLINKYFDFISFYKELSLKNTPKRIILNLDNTPDFYPFNCSCGESGCAGIWNGISLKKRRHTIEWRAKKEDGYAFLNKNFLKFNRSDYEYETVVIKNKLINISNNDENEYLVYDFGRYLKISNFLKELN